MIADCRKITAPPTVLSLGANECGAWGDPLRSFARALAELSAAGARITCVSSLYETAPVGSVRQSTYYNAVVVCEYAAPLGCVLRSLKAIERRAGRRPRARLSARPLDIDLIGHGGRVIGWPPARRYWERLVVPHAEMHRRLFVLVPLVEIAPDWWHPALGQTARTLLARIPRPPNSVVKVADRADLWQIYKRERPGPAGGACLLD